MNSTILAASVPTTQDDLRITDAAVEAAARAVSLDWETVIPGMRAALEAAVPYLAPQYNDPHNGVGSPAAWLESHLQQYTDAVLALGQPGGSRVATPHYLR